MVVYVEEPQTLEEALGSENRKQWHEAWELEVDSLIRNMTWVLTQLPAGREPIGCQWLFKRIDDGRFKARLVAKGYTEKEGIDYNKRFAPILRFNCLRTLLALVCEINWELQGMDVKTAFLQSELDKIVFMDIPEGLYTETSTLEAGDPMVGRLVKSIYGLKQSPRAWYGRINNFFLDHGFQRSEQDHSVYIHRFFKVILLLYVDDLVITAPSIEDVLWIQTLLHEEFEMTDLGPLMTFLGMEIRRNRDTGMLHLSQQRYIQTILEPYGMLNYLTVSTPADTHVRLLKSAPDQQTDTANRKRYQSAVGLLIHAMIGTRPDIAFAVSAVSQQNSNPGATHWTAVRRIFRYLSSTKRLGLIYGSGLCARYTDAD